MVAWATNKSMTLLRWLCVGGLICLAGLTKGPQPVAYFALGVGAYLCLKQRDQIPAFLAVNAGTGLVIGCWYLTVYSAPGDIKYWLLRPVWICFVTTLISQRASL
jgi:hypothetical protein